MGGSSTESSEEECIEENKSTIAEGNVPMDIDPTVVPKLGMVFDTEEDAFRFYVAYGCRAGFGITRRSNNTFDGFRYRSTFICNKGGVSRYKGTPKTDKKQGSKTGCKAKMIVKDHHFQNRWEVIDLELEHNHALDPNSLKFKTPLRKSPCASRGKPQRSGAVDAEQCSAFAAPSAAETTISASEFTEFETREDRIRKLVLGEGDLDALIAFFDAMQDQNPYFFYSLDLNDDGQLRNVFWADARSRGEYNYFGDVISFKLNNFSDQYGFLFASFVGVNHHLQPVLLGCGLISAKNMFACMWLFTTFLRCMNGRQPGAVIIDYCQEIDQALKMVFPDARHCFCLSHILKLLDEKLDRVEEKDVISSSFSRVIYESVTIPDFERDWQEMMQRFGLDNRGWFSGLHETRKQWAPVYLKDNFWAGMSSIDGSCWNDCFGNYFDGLLSPGTKVKNFIENYDNFVKAKVEKEAHEDYRNAQISPQLISALPLEGQIAKTYTLAIFQKFQNEIKSMLQLSGNLFDKSGSVNSYIITEFVNGRKTDCRVAYDSVEDDIWCLCRLFQHKGILCRHAIFVLRQELIMLIPEKYITLRWRKDCKRFFACVTQRFLGPTHELGSYDDLYRRIHQYFLETVEFGSGSHELEEYTLSVLQEVKDKVITFEKSLRDQRVDNCVVTTNYSHDPINEDFRDDVSPMTLSMKGWDVTQVNAKRNNGRKKKLSTPTLLKSLNKRKKRAVDTKKDSSATGPTGAGLLSVGTSALNSVINEATHVHVQEGWSLSPAGAAPETFPFGAETISFDLSQYNSAPTFQWLDGSNRRIL